MRQGKQQSFLFLQGPCGPFFRKLGKALSQRGHSVLRINFNGGDVLQWPGGLTRNFPGLPQDWPEYVRSLQEKHGFTDLCLFGDSKPYHHKAISILKEYGVRVHVFEEGYFRPYWITLEREGVNANSRLPRDPEFYHRQTSRIQRRSPSLHVGKAPRHFFRYYLNYFLATLCLSGLFPQYKRNSVYPATLRLYPTSSEAIGDSLRWGFRLLSSKWRNDQAEPQVEKLGSQGASYFLAPLQLSIDTQITCHSPFSSMPEYLTYVIQNFAHHAPSDTTLVLKNHPLDPAVRANRMMAELESFRQGVMDRVVFIDGGNLPRILKHCCGVVLINSTTGLSALHHGVPCITLGKALYDMNGLTHQGSLESFWKEPTFPDNDLYLAFRKVIMHETQVNGSFYTPKGLRLAVQASLERLEAAPVTRSFPVSATEVPYPGREEVYQQSSSYFN